MSRYQAYPPPGPVLLAAVTGASMLQTVLVELGIVSADGIGGLGWIIARVIPPIPLSVLLTGPLFLGAVYAVYSGEWRKSIKGELRRGTAPRQRISPFSTQEWEARIFYVTAVLIGAELVVMGFRSGFLFVPPIVFWAAGGVLILGGGLTLLFDGWYEEMIHMRRNSSRVPQASITGGGYYYFADGIAAGNEFDDSSLDEMDYTGLLTFE